MFELIAEMLRGSAPDDLSNALNSDRTQTRRAMEIGLPALITGLRDKTFEPGGAQALADMLSTQGAKLPADVGAYLRSGESGEGQILIDSAFGDRGQSALSNLSSASGLPAPLLALVMSVMAPLATGVLANRSDQSPDAIRLYLTESVKDLENKGFGRVVELASPGLSAISEPAPEPEPVLDDQDLFSSTDLGLDEDEPAFVSGITQSVAPAIAASAGIEDSTTQSSQLTDAASAGNVVEGAFPSSLEEPKAPELPSSVFSDGPIPPTASSDESLFSNTAISPPPQVSPTPDPVGASQPDQQLGFTNETSAQESVSAQPTPPPAFQGQPSFAEPQPVTVPGIASPSAEVEEDVDLSVLDGPVEIDYAGRKRVNMSWIWILLSSIIIGLLVFFAITQCGNSSNTNESANTAGDGTQEPAAVPTPDPETVQLQSQLNQVVAPFPGVSGEVKGRVAVLVGTVPTDNDKAIIDQQARAIPGIEGASNQITVVAVEPEGYSLQDLVLAQPELSTLNALLIETGLDAALEGNGPFTLFAPTNDAFNEMGPQLDELRANPELLAAILSYHVVSGSLTAAEIGSTSALTTAETEDIQIASDENGIALNGESRLIFKDAAARNGTMHFVSKVLLPPSVSAQAAPAVTSITDGYQPQPVTFGSGSDQLTAEGQAELDRVAQFLLENPQQIEVGGHTDSDGPTEVNRTLSQKRAQAVLDYLVSKGIPGESLTAVGYGEDHPIVANDTAANKAINRRIEFTPIG